IYDETGQLLTTSFMDYLKPTAADLPNIEGDRLETPSPLTMLGTKGVGEGGAVVAPAAIASAVEDALTPLGIRIAALPIVPSRLWETAAAGEKRYENARIKSSIRNPKFETNSNVQKQKILNATFWI